MFGLFRKTVSIDIDPTASLPVKAEDAQLLTRVAATASDREHAQQVITAVCRRNKELERALADAGVAVPLKRVDGANPCPVVHGRYDGPAGCPQTSCGPNYDASGRWIGNPVDLCPPACPACS